MLFPQSPGLRLFTFSFMVATTLFLVACGGGSMQQPIAPATPTPSPTPTPTPPPVLPGAPPPTANAVSGQTVVSAIQKMGDWQSCNGSGCAGGHGRANYSLKQGVQAPSMSGAAAQFSISGSTPFANVLWWRQLDPNNHAKNFVYDLYVYITEPTAPQALEFDVNQSIGDLKFIFGTECDFLGTHTWHVWDTARHTWVSTDAPCKPFPPNQWNHVVLQFHRTDDNKAEFVSVSVNDVTHALNRKFDPIKVHAEELNVAFQMDSNGSAQDFTVWLDNVTLKYW